MNSHPREGMIVDAQNGCNIPAMIAGIVQSLKYGETEIVFSDLKSVMVFVAEVTKADASIVWQVGPPTAPDLFDPGAVAVTISLKP